MEEQRAATATKTCPMCAEEIKAAAIVCRFCGHRFDEAAAPAALPPKPDESPPEMLTKQLRAGEDLFVWSDGYLWAASGHVAVTSDRILFVDLGGNVHDHPLAVERRVSVADQVVDVELGGGLWRFQHLHPEVAKEIAATIVPGLIEKMYADDDPMRTTLRSRHESVVQRAPALAPKVSVSVKGCKYLGGISALGSGGMPFVSIVFNPRDIQIKALGRTAFTISEPKSGGVAIEGHEQLQQRLSVTRMATLGVFSLAAPRRLGERRATSL